MIDIIEGDTFIHGTPGCVQRIMRIGAIHPTVDLIPCTEERLINASPLAKVNGNYYYYFTKQEIINCIRKNGMVES